MDKFDQMMNWLKQTETSERRFGQVIAVDREFELLDRAWCVAWEPQGRFLATCSSDRTARLWAPSRAAGGAWVTVAELEGVHNRTVRSVAWSPCGTSARRADPRETYLFPFSPSRSLRVPAALRRFFRALETFCVSENETTD